MNSKCKINGPSAHYPNYSPNFSPSKLKEDEKNVCSLLLPL